MNNVVIVSATRTAVGKFGGILKDLSPIQLGSVVSKDALKRANVGADDVNEIVLGNVLSAGHGQNMARQVAIGAGIPKEVPSYCLKKARWGVRMGNDEIIDLMVSDGLWDVFNNYHMGITAENVAEKYNVTREEQDEFAAKSQNKAEAAITDGVFKEIG